MKIARFCFISSMSGFCTFLAFIVSRTQFIVSKTQYTIYLVRDCVFEANKSWRCYVVLYQYQFKIQTLCLLSFLNVYKKEEYGIRVLVSFILKSSLSRLSIIYKGNVSICIFSFYMFCGHISVFMFWQYNKLNKKHVRWLINLNFHYYAHCLHVSNWN